MLVATGKIVTGTAEPTANFVGTIYFSRTAEVAAEVEGVVKQVYIDDGQVIKAGQRLIRLDDDLLETEINGTRALYEQNQVDVRQAEKDYQRIAALHEQDAIATSEYESYDTRLNRLRKQSTVLKARLDRQLLEQKKKTVRAPFDGLVVESLVDAGEWVKAGGIVASVADNSSLEAHVDIPAEVIPLLSPGQEAPFLAAGTEMTGHFVSIIPRGDITSRTFVAKFKLPGDLPLVEGMATTVKLPVSVAREGLLVPRDAVINKFGRDVVFIVKGGLAEMVSVDVTGYSAMQLSVSGDGLDAGQDVIIKGHERIFNTGTPVRTGP